MHEQTFEPAIGELEIEAAVCEQEFLPAVM